ncbi:MAG: thioredoxin family protein [Gammaproteobacteria bacterium]
MSLMQTPICDFGKPAPDFALQGIDGKKWSLTDCAGERGTLVMFICNHCPYVQAVIDRLVRDCNELLEYGVKPVAIMPNDVANYPADSLPNMQKFAHQHGFGFPYLIDETQTVARDYDAICTPDFFGYNADLQLQYRGRLDASKMQPAPADAPRELFQAMRQIAETGQGPAEQIPSMGCSIKWKT